MTTDFNLSEKIHPNLSHVEEEHKKNYIKWINLEDAKEFIRRLKEEITEFAGRFQDDEHRQIGLMDSLIFINKLAGDELK